MYNIILRKTMSATQLPFQHTPRFRDHVRALSGEAGLARREGATRHRRVMLNDSCIRETAGMDFVYCGRRHTSKATACATSCSSETEPPSGDWLYSARQYYLVADSRSFDVDPAGFGDWLTAPGRRALPEMIEPGIDEVGEELLLDRGKAPDDMFVDPFYKSKRCDGAVVDVGIDCEFGLVKVNSGA